MRTQPWSVGRWLAWGVLPLIGLLIALFFAMDIAVGLKSAKVAQAPLAGPLAAQSSLFLRLNEFARVAPDFFWSFVTLLGDTVILFVVLSPLILFKPQAMMAVIAAVPFGGLFSVLAKRVFDLPRPAGVLDSAQFHLGGPLLANHTFPSGHTLSIFAAVAAVLASCLPTQSALRSFGLLATGIGLALLVGFSRIAVGAHWPLDVLGGACAGWLAGLFGAAIARRNEGVWQSQHWQAITSSLFLLAAIWLWWRPLDYPQGAGAIWLATACVTVTVAIQLGRWAQKQSAP